LSHSMAPLCSPFIKTFELFPLLHSPAAASLWHVSNATQKPISWTRSLTCGGHSEFSVPCNFFKRLSNSFYCFQTTEVIQHLPLGAPGLELLGCLCVRVFCLVGLFSFLFFWYRVLLCSTSWPWTQDSPASASQVLRLQVCILTPGCTQVCF
jgi:hypothetical protein